MDKISKLLIQTTIDMQENLIAVFKNEELVLSNKAFNKFFGIENSAAYSENFGPFVNNFVPHPLYFHQDKVPKGQSFFEAISLLEKSERIVSMMSPSHDPFAFSIEVQILEEAYVVMRLEDISQSLIKRLMIDNGANIDIKSGAYSKEYFTHIAPSLEEAARFNEKNLASTIVSFNTQELDTEVMLRVASQLLGSIRHDDMLIKYSSTAFLLVFLVDNLDNVQTFNNKLLKLLGTDYSEKSFSINSVLKERGESVLEMVSRVELAV